MKICKHPVKLTHQRKGYCYCAICGKTQIEELKKHANDFEELYKQEHREKNALKRQIEAMNVTQ